jgi:hypothetical protein
MSRRRRVVLVVLILAGLVVSAPGRPATAADPPQVKHVWTIMLENSDLAATTAQDLLLGSGYLTTDLARRGAFVPNYFGTGHSSLDNYLAMISGQGPTDATQDDCNNDSVTGGSYDHSTFDADGQALGDPATSCVYAADVPTVVQQLEGAGLTWRGYMEDVDARPTSLRTTCQAARWANRLNAPPGAVDRPTSYYARKHDPFVYFHSITGLEPASGAPSASCDANDVALPRLFDDLQSPATTPSFSYIVPNQCNDGHDNPTCGDGSTGGVARIDQFLPTVVEPILSSAAYADGGLLIITFDEGTEAFACCGEVTSPNLGSGNNNGFADPTRSPLTMGGGQIGAIMISPFITPGTVSTECYNHYSYLRSMEDLFRLTPDRTGIPGSDGLGHLGYAGRLGDGVTPCGQMRSFGSDIFTNAPASATAARRAPLLPKVRRAA